ncbi:MAG: chromosome partitioning protein ParB [Pseudomonadota bacterium]
MKGLILKVLPAVMVIALALFHPVAQAEGKCKGLSKSACSTNSSCSWVKSYKTKAGKNVAAYCRVKSAKNQTKNSKSKDGKKPKEAVKAKTKEQKKAKKQNKTKKAKQDNSKPTD